jgi:hypothetical protein
MGYLGAHDIDDRTIDPEIQTLSSILFVQVVVSRENEEAHGK